MIRNTEQFKGILRNVAGPDGTITWTQRDNLVKQLGQVAPEERPHLMEAAFELVTSAQNPLNPSPVASFALLSVMAGSEREVNGTLNSALSSLVSLFPKLELSAGKAGTEDVQRIVGLAKEAIVAARNRPLVIEYLRAELAEMALTNPAAAKEIRQALQFERDDAAHVSSYYLRDKKQLLAVGNAGPGWQPWQDPSQSPAIDFPSVLTELCWDGTPERKLEKKEVDALIAHLDGLREPGATVGFGARLMHTLLGTTPDPGKPKFVKAGIEQLLTSLEALPGEICEPGAKEALRAWAEGVLGSDRVVESFHWQYDSIHRDNKGVLLRGEQPSASPAAQVRPSAVESKLQAALRTELSELRAPFDDGLHRLAPGEVPLQQMKSFHRIASKYLSSLPEQAQGEWRAEDLGFLANSFLAMHKAIEQPANKPVTFTDRSRDRVNSEQIWRADAATKHTYRWDTDGLDAAVKGIHGGLTELADAFLPSTTSSGAGASVAEQVARLEDAFSQYERILSAVDERGLDERVTSERVWMKR